MITADQARKDRDRAIVVIKANYLNLIYKDIDMAVSSGASNTSFPYAASAEIKEYAISDLKRNGYKIEEMNGVTTVDWS